MEQEQLEILGLQELEDGTHIIHARTSSTPAFVTGGIAIGISIGQSGASLVCRN